MKRKEINQQKNISPADALKEMKNLRTRLTMLEKNIVIEKEQSKINISKDVTFKPYIVQGKIIAFDIFHYNWCVGSLWFKEFPEFRTHNQHYEIQWLEGNVRILWDGKR